ncbi:MAG: hypothetical protein IKZ28_03470 [Clostridia bacterium]|nr:hypothetical protein [Clostridia bacterium]
MKATNNNRKSKFLALLLSVMMVSSAGALFASCKDSADSSSPTDSSSTEDTTSDKKDLGEIKNASFSFTKVTDTNAIGTSVTGWTRSVNSAASGTAVSSKSASGVLDTSDDAWKYLTVSNYDKETLESMTDAQAEEAWDNFNAKDKLAYYEIWKARPENKDVSISGEKGFKKYESINIDEDDVPAPTFGTGSAQNPKTHTLEEGDTRELDSNILMIHNEYSTSTTSKTMGTAQKYTSSSTVTIPAGSAAEFSVWVRTSDLQCAGTGNTSQDAVGKGAYISVTHSVGGKSLDAYEVKNINTNEWTKYTFYIQGSSYTNTTFSIVLGLGQGGGSDRLDYVNGYAFFDDIQFKYITQGEFETKTTGMDKADLQSEKVDKTVDAYVSDKKTFAMDFYSAWDNLETTAPDFFTSLTSKPTESTDGIDINDKKVNANKDVVEVFDGRADVLATYNSDTVKYEYLNYVYNDYLTDKDLDKDGNPETNFIENDKILLILSQGAAYTVESSYNFTIPASQDYAAISFYVKTSSLGNGVGAGITLVDGLAKTSFASLNTSALDGVKVGEDEDAYDGWKQVFFFIEKSEDLQGSDATFQLHFNYGPTDITAATTGNSFAQGFAAFSKFEIREMTELEYDSAQTDTYAKKVTLVGNEEKDPTANGGFDSAAGVPSNALEKGLANLQNYKGVYGDSYRVHTPASGETIDSTKLLVNQYANAGLLNREKFTQELVDDNAGEAWLEGLKTTANSTDAKTIWNTMFGEDVSQPLLIWNEGMTKSYGFIGASKTLSDEYTAVSIRVKTSDNAYASVYLMDMDDDKHETVLSVGGTTAYTFWYDDNGNLCDGDPKKISTQIAFKLDKDNGLYTANTNWKGYTEDMAGKYYANLSAYETNDNGDKIAASDSASHDYYDYTWNREVFYGNDGKFFTKDNGEGVEVLDLTTLAVAGTLPYRYAPQASQELKFENINTKGEWATVTFYIRKGAETKNYRLEVWSGTRAGAANSGNGYVIFDTNNAGSVANNFANLVTEYKDKVAEGETFEGVFSYYDTDKHVRYDAEMDSDNVGNLYAESFVPSTYTAGTVYLYYTETNASDIVVKYNKFADYSLSEVTITAKSETEEDDTTTEEEEDTASEMNVWLLASSIAVAAVLVLAVMSIVIRKLVEKSRKTRGVKVRKAKTAKKEKATPVAKKTTKNVDEDSPYND